jgi:hypothetical protein
MSGFHWSQTQFEERWFHILACLLARIRQQQDTNTGITLGTGSATPLEEDDESDTGDDENATTTPRNIAKENGKPKLLRKFLDRLAEVMAHEIAPDMKADDVCATGILEYEDHVKVFVAKNGGLRDDDNKMMKHLQIWLRTLSVLGERRDVKRDEMWKKMVIWSEPRLLYYRKTLASIFQHTGIIWSSSDMSPLIDRKLAALQEFCSNEPDAPVEKFVEQWTEIITICYELRYEPVLESYLKDRFNKRGILALEKASALWRNLAFLGRLRAA